MLCWSLVYFFFPFPVFWNLVPYVTKHGVPVVSLPDFTDNFNVSYKRSYNPIGFKQDLLATLLPLYLCKDEMQQTTMWSTVTKSPCKSVFFWGLFWSCTKLPCWGWINLPQYNILSGPKQSSCERASNDSNSPKP